MVYQPLSKVIHFEGVSNGTDVNGSGLKRYQVENSEKLKEKWAEEFKKQCVNTGNPNPFRARERSQGKKSSWWWITTCLPLTVTQDRRPRSST